MKCSACEEGLHYLCGMQTWCECDCDGIYETWGLSPDDDMPHTDTCTCEYCAQIYPERLPESWQGKDDDLFCIEHQCMMNLVDYEDGGRYECPECQRERGETLGLR